MSGIGYNGRDPEWKEGSNKSRLVKGCDILISGVPIVSSPLPNCTLSKFENKYTCISSKILNNSTRVPRALIYDRICII